MRREYKSRLRRVLKTLRVAVVGLTAVVASVGVGGYLISSSGLFLPLRQGVVNELLTEILKRNVEVRGSVRVHLGSTLNVSIQDAFVASSATSTKGEERAFEKVVFQAGYGLLIGRLGSISDFSMSGASVVFSKAEADDKGRRASAFELPSLLLNSPVLENLELIDVTFTYQDPGLGWDEVLHISAFELVTPKDRAKTSLEFDASFNGTPFSIDGVVNRNLGAGAKTSNAFDFVVSFPGLITQATGSIDTSTKVARVDGSVKTTVSSVAQLLSSMGFTSKRDGQATVGYDFTGPLDDLTISNLNGHSKTDEGDQIGVVGTVQNATSAPVVDVKFEIALASAPETSGEQLAVEVTGVSGRLLGSPEALSIKEARVNTTAAVLDFASIGPISVGKVVKNEDDMIGLENIAVLDGPPDAPYIDLTGDLDDLFAFTGLTLSGRFNFPTGALFANEASMKELGRIEGEVTLDDQDGLFGIDRLTGQSRDTSLYDLAFHLAVPELRVVDDLKVSTDFSMSAPHTFLRALGVETAAKLPSLKFSGQSHLAANALKLKGAVTSGASSIEADVDLSRNKDEKVWLASGQVNSDKLDIGDFVGLSAFSNLRLADPQDSVTLTEDPLTGIRAVIAIAARELVTGKKKAGNLSTELHYENDHVRLVSLIVQFLGGTIKGDFGLDFAGPRDKVHAKGRMEKFPMKALLNELGLKSPVSSTVYSSFDVTGTGDTERALLRTLTGNVTTSLWGGVLPNRLLELSGMNAFTWWVSGNKEGTAKLVCSVLPLHFNNGVASGRSIIIETENVQVVGSGSVNFKNGALDLSFVPRAKRKQFVEIVSPFEINGTVAKPELTVHQAGAGRVVGEVLSTPLNLLGHIFRGSGQVDDKARPCVLPKASGPK